MTTEREMIEIVKAEFGDKFNVVIANTNELSAKIASDIELHWDDWIKESEKLGAPVIAVRLSLFFTLVGYFARDCVDNNVPYEKYLKLCSDVYDLTEEHVNNTKKPPN